MTEATKVTKYPIGSYPTTIEKLTNVSGANASLSLSTPIGKLRRLLHVTVKYSAAPTHSGITVELDNGIGSAHDVELDKSAANLQNYPYIPGDKLVINDDDVIKVTAPAAGGVITSAISIVTEIGE